STKTAKHKYDVRSGFLQNQLELFRKLKVDFGARIDNYSSFDNTEVSPNAGLLYQPDEKTNLRLFYGQSYRVPTFSDLYWSSPSSRGNPDLEPERGKSYEFGIEREILKNLSFNLTYFRNDYRNLIKWNSVNGIWQTENISKATVQGVEFGNKTSLTDCLDLNVSYTYQRPMDNILHKLLTYQPQYKINSFLEFHNYRGLRVKLKWEFVSRSFDNTANTIYVKRYFLMGMEASKKINKYATFFATINNLTNIAYQVRRGYPMPGFSIDGGFKAEF
ncbi:MAG: TonB-dependent receptor, partial [Candidatus Omnitrophota bacterium]